MNSFSLGSIWCSGAGACAFLACSIAVWVGCTRDSQPARSRACADASACADSEYCAFEPGLCGKGERAGECRARPRACAAHYAPVCACDGKVYDDACAARAAGIDLDVRGGCRSSLPNYIPCGAHFCDARSSYCEIYLSDVFELPTSHLCKPLPAACLPGGGAARSCACFPEATPCRMFCGPLPSGAGVQGFHLTCQGVKEPPTAR